MTNTFLRALVNLLRGDGHQHQAHQQPTSQTLSRDIPQLYPDFYEQALRDIGKPVTPANVVALANFTTANLALNVHQWMQHIGTDLDRARWSARFGGDEPNIQGLMAR